VPFEAATPAALRPATPTVASPTSAPTGRPARTLIPPAGQRGFLASLKAIDRALAADRERALDHAVDICYQLYDGKPRETIRTYAREAYSGSTHRISRATARKIVARAERWVCRDGTLHSRWES
jgi:hypothetical protein